MKIYMYDFGREQSWVSEHWQRYIRDLAELGYTHFGLYIEQRYHFESLPQHRPLGGLTPKQAIEAHRLCKKHGMELVWFTNTLGHCGGLLANEAFGYLAEDIGAAYQLCPSHPHTRPLIKKMLAEFAATSSSELLMIGGDECKMNEDERCKTRGLRDAELYLDHYKWVIRETKKLGKRPGMWGDMLLHYPEIIGEIDRDVLIFDWHYSGGSADTIKLFQSHGLEVIPTTATSGYEAPFLAFEVTESAIKPFMNEARELGCAGICQSAWEFWRGAYPDTEWPQVAAATAYYEGRPFDNSQFAADFFGSPKADFERLRPLLSRTELGRIHPIFSINEFRTQFVRSDSAYYFYHVYGQPDARPVLDEVVKRVRQSRQVVHDIRQAATRRQEYLEFLDITLDIFDASYDRIQTLAHLREIMDKIYPHRLPNAEGARLLRGALRRLEKHIELCEKLRERFEALHQTRGASFESVLHLRRQILELRTLAKYVRYHTGAYAKGVPLVTHEMWYL